MKTAGILGTLLLLAVGAAGRPEPGTEAPAFEAEATGEKRIALSDLKGRWVVLFFYPRSFTSGCTAQACSLRDGHEEIEKLGAVILGASLDSIERQERFKEEHRLPFDLLADEGGDVARAYGVLAPGRLLARRVTFLIDPEGRVARVIDRVQTGTHEEQVREALTALQRSDPD